VKVRVTAAASGDLEQIWAFTAENWGQEQADLYIDRLILRFAWLTGNPGLWHARPEVGASIYSCVETSHVIFFSSKNAIISILRVLHSRMDPASRIG
jgi:toxin ParE1/3/4